MQFAFSEDQVLFRDTVRDFLTNECPPAVVRAAWESDTGIAADVWGGLAEMGVVGLTAPEAAGGLGMSDVDLVMLLEEAGRAALPAPLVEHTAVGIPALGDHEAVEAAAAGELLVSIGLAGSAYVVGAEQADLLVLEADDRTLHAVPREAVGLEPVASIDGSRRLAKVEWTPASDTALASDPVLAFDRGALGAAAQCVGVAQSLVDTTVEYVKERQQFGKAVGTYQAVKHHLANAALGVTFARPCVYRAAWCVAEGVPEASREVSTAKALASDAVDLAARIALQCHGAIGYTYEYDLQLWLKRGWALAAAYGDAAWHRDRVGHALGV